jgi:hypothetical protein
MPQTTDRDPSNPEAVGRAVAVWAATMGPEISHFRADEADAALVAVLLDQGVLSPADIDCLSIERESAWHGLVHIFLEDSDGSLSCLQIEQDGAVSTIDC